MHDAPASRSNRARTGPTSGATALAGTLLASAILTSTAAAAGQPTRRALPATTAVPSDAASLDPEAGHGPRASAYAFPSHRFQLAPHTTKTQLSFHYGLLQPILLNGFNAAVDLRVGRLVLSYSHGQGLEVSRAPGVLTPAEKQAGMRVVAPYSTGGGIGLTLIDELYVMADFKVHRYEVYAGGPIASYSTVTVGAEMGYRFFLWKGLHVTPVLRYWPNVADTAPDGGVSVTTANGELKHEPVSQGAGGFFANVLVGWAFDV